MPRKGEKKNEMTVTELARLGGIMRRKSLSPERRTEIARAAGKAGGRGRKKK